MNQSNTPGCDCIDFQHACRVLALCERLREHHGRLLGGVPGTVLALPRNKSELRAMEDEIQALCRNLAGFTNIAPGTSVELLITELDLIGTQYCRSIW